MAAGLVTHNIVTAPSGGTFTVRSWVPDTTAPDVGAVPVAILTDGVTFVPIVNNSLAVNTGQGQTLGTAPTGAAREGTPAWVVRTDGSTAIPHGLGMYSYMGTDPAGRLWVNANGTVGLATTANTVKFDQTNPNNVIKVDSSQLSPVSQTTSALSVSTVLASDYGVPLATDKMFAGTAALTPTFAPIDVSTSGPNTIVAAVTSKRIRVISLYLNASAAVNARWRSAANSLGGLSYLSAVGDGFVLDFNPLGWIQTNAGEALILDLSSGVAVGGFLNYVAV
jgi:hypothetical protein